MNNFNDIERFLKEKMNTSEADLFKKKIEENPDLALEVELQRSENNALEDIAYDLLKEEIIALGDTKLEEENVKSTTFENRYLLIFGIITFIAVLIFFLYRFNSSSKEQIIDDSQNIKEQQLEAIPQDTEKKLDETPNINDGTKKDESPIKEGGKRKETNKKPIPKYPLIALNEYKINFQDIGVRGIENDLKTNPKWKEIIANFNTKKYKETILLVNKLSKDDRYILDAEHLKAKSLFLSSQFAAASSVYLDLIKNGDPFQLYNYEFELLLCYLAQLNETKPQFNKLLDKLISEPDHTFQQAASQLSKKII